MSFQYLWFVLQNLLGVYRTRYFRNLRSVKDPGKAAKKRWLNDIVGVSWFSASKRHFNDAAREELIRRKYNI